MYQTPILYLVYNRLHQVKLSFGKLKELKPTNLYIAADGPKNNSESKEKCQQVRDYIINNINWECNPVYLFQNKNLGCKKAVSSAITWFFQNVSKGIIIEDDILAEKEFFNFCSILLDKYEFDDSIISISGFNFGYNSENLFTSRFINMWGWATWKRSALTIDYEMVKWKNYNNLYKHIFIVSRLRQKLKVDKKWLEKWIKIFNDTSNDKIDTWDYQWIFHALNGKKRSIFLPYNYIKNTGFGDESATHTIDNNDFLSEIDISEFKKNSSDNLDLTKEFFFENNYLKKYWIKQEKTEFINVFRYFIKIFIIKKLIKLAYVIFKRH